MSRITEIEQILDSVLIHDVRQVWRESAGIMSQIQQQLPPGPQAWPFLSKEYAPEAYLSVIMLNLTNSFEDMFRAMDDRLCFYLRESIFLAQDKALRYGETLSNEDIVEWALRVKLGQPPLDNYRQVRSFVHVQAALRALDRCLDFLRTARGESAADRQRGQKVKLPMDVFERDIFPILNREFPSGGDNAGIKKRCAEIGKQHGVSESTIKSKFYDVLNKKQGNKPG